MQLIYQLMNEQIIPQQTAHNHQDVPAGLSFESGSLLVGSGPFENARIVPGRQLCPGQMIGNNKFLNRAEEPGRLPSDRCGSEVSCNSRPKALIAQERRATQQEEI